MKNYIEIPTFKEFNRQSIFSQLKLLTYRKCPINVIYYKIPFSFHSSIHKPSKCTHMCTHAHTQINTHLIIFTILSS